MTNDVAPRMRGAVATLFPQSGFGFIAGDDGIRYVFFRSDAPEFDRLSRDARVIFATRGGAKGPRAGSVFLILKENLE
jgi:cold shock CspA family protein